MADPRLIDWRFTKGNRSRFPEFAAELVRLKVDCIVTSGTGSTRAAKKATRTTPIPVVMANVGDPVGSGLVASLARPGGNVTGLSDFHGDLVAKRVELLKEVVPSALSVAVLFNPASGGIRRYLRDVQAAASALDATVLPLAIKGADDFDRALATITKKRPGGLIQSVALGRYQTSSDRRP